MNKNNNHMIWLSSPHMCGDESYFVQDAIVNNQVFPLGKNVLDFEQSIKKYCGSLCCSCLSSGTAAIHLGLIMLNVLPEDEVICSTFTFAASAYPILYQRAIPVFVDSESDTWNMDPYLLREAIEDRIKKTGKKPKAILVVHLYGMPANMQELMAVSEEYNIPILEDAAEALGSRYADHHCGTMGEIGVYSFNGNKIITTSGGGALISNNQDYCIKATYYATQARDDAPHYQHSEVGYNYRMSNISAGIGLGQIRVLEDRVNKRRDNNNYYRDVFKNIASISFQTEPEKKYYSNYWLTSIVIDTGKTEKLDREKIRISLYEQKIETRPLWKPMHMQPVFKEYPSFINGVSDRLFRDGLCIPSGSIMTDNTRQYVAERIIELFEKDK